MIGLMPEHRGQVRSVQRLANSARRDANEEAVDVLASFGQGEGRLPPRLGTAHRRDLGDGRPKGTRATRVMDLRALYYCSLLHSARSI